MAVRFYRIRTRAARTSKYNAVRTQVDGITFSSKKEAAFYCQLKQRQVANNGDVAFFLRQVPFDLPGGVRYFLDFMVFEKPSVQELRTGPANTIRFIDVKGMKTAVYRIKKKQVEALYGIEIEEA